MNKMLECLMINKEGEEIATEPDDAIIRDASVAIILYHKERIIYIFKGKKSSIRKKFAAARLASTKRLQLAYNIKHIDAVEGIDDEFLPILELLGGIQSKEQKKAPIYNPKKDELPAKTQKVVALSRSQSPPNMNEEMLCTHLFVVSNGYKVRGVTKEDMRTGEFRLEKITAGHSDDAFNGTAYVPRLLIENGKIVGFELWKKL
jgi:hypothetical protein